MTEAVHLHNRALELSRRLDDPETFWWVAGCVWLMQVTGPRYSEERRLLAEELADRSRTGVTMRTLGTALSFTSLNLLEFGRRQRAEELIAEVWEITERSGQANLWFLGMILKGALATLDGRLEEVDEMGRQIRVRGEELNLGGYAALMEFLASSVARTYLGKFDEVARNTDELGLFSTLSLIGSQMLHYRKDETETLLEKIITRPGFGTPEDGSATSADTFYLESAVAVENRRAVEFILRGLSETESCTTGLYYMRGPSRHFGDAAAFLGRPDEARKHYQRGLELAAQIKNRPETALTRLQLAELLLEHYPKEKKEALEHLDFAINEFREMKMQPSLERALRHKEIMGA